MKYILYIFYRYYNKGQTKDIAYEKTVLVFLLLLFINIFTLLIFFDAADLFDYFKQKNKFLKYMIFGVLYFLPGYFIINHFVKRNDLKNSALELKYKSIHGLILVLYIVFSVLLLIFVIKTMNNV